MAGHCPPRPPPACSPTGVPVVPSPPDAAPSHCVPLQVVAGRPRSLADPAAEKPSPQPRAWCPETGLPPSPQCTRRATATAGHHSPTACGRTDPHPQVGAGTAGGREGEDTRLQEASHQGAGGGRRVTGAVCGIQRGAGQRGRSPAVMWQAGRQAGPAVAAQCKPSQAASPFSHRFHAVPLQPPDHAAAGGRHGLPTPARPLCRQWAPGRPPPRLGRGAEASAVLTVRDAVRQRVTPQPHGAQGSARAQQGLQEEQPGVEWALPTPPPSPCPPRKEPLSPPARPSVRPELASCLS